jgi:hypothetical protein
MCRRVKRDVLVSHIFYTVYGINDDEESNDANQHNDNDNDDNDHRRQ